MYWRPRPNIVWAYQKEKIRKWLEEGKPLKWIAAQYGVSSQRIHKIAKAFKILPPYPELPPVSEKYLTPTNTIVNKVKKLVKGGRPMRREVLKELLPPPETCPVLGIPLEYGPRPKGQRGKPARENVATIDRIDSSKGYVPGNCVIISWRANRLKSNGSAEEHLKIGSFFKDLEQRVEKSTLPDDPNSAKMPEPK